MYQIFFIKNVEINLMVRAWNSVNKVFREHSHYPRLCMGYSLYNCIYHNFIVPLPWLSAPKPTCKHIHSSCEVCQNYFLQLVAMIRFNIYFTASLLESDLNIVWLVSKEFGAEICIFFEKKKNLQACTYAHPVKYTKQIFWNWLPW